MIKWISPTLAGFSLSTSWDGDDFWDVALRYAGEFRSIRVGAGIGYQKETNSVDSASFGANCGNGPAGAQRDRECSALGISGTVQHVPTGLYMRGSYGRDENELVTNDQDVDDGW